MAVASFFLCGDGGGHDCSQDHAAISNDDDDGGSSSIKSGGSIAIIAYDSGKEPIPQLFDWPESILAQLFKTTSATSVK